MKTSNSLAGLSATNESIHPHVSPMEKNDVAVYYLLPWHLLFTVAIYYLGHMLFVGSILLWSTIDINRYTEILDACSQKLRCLHQEKIVEKGPENFERQPISKVPLGLPGFHLWALQIEIALPSSVDMAQLWISTSQELCFVFFFCDIQPPGQGCGLTRCTPNRFLQMGVD